MKIFISEERYYIYREEYNIVIDKLDNRKSLKLVVLYIIIIRLKILF